MADAVSRAAAAAAAAAVAGMHSNTTQRQQDSNMHKYVVKMENKLVAESRVAINAFNAEMAGKADGEQFRQGLILKYENTVAGLQNVYTEHAVYNERMVGEYEVHVHKTERERDLRMEHAQMAVQEAQRDFQQAQIAAHQWQTKSKAGAVQILRMQQSIMLR